MTTPTIEEFKVEMDERATILSTLGLLKYLRCPPMATPSEGTYVQHLPRCRWFGNAMPTCDCGLREVLAALRARGAAERSPAPTWQPIETAPKDQPILAYSQMDGKWIGQPGKLVDEIVVSHWWKGDELNTPRWGSCSGIPTHWMKLPSPPSAGSEASKT